MKTRFLHKKHIIPFAIVTLVLLTILLPIQFPYTIDAPGKVLPVREWILQRSADGNLFSTLSNHIEGIVENFTITQIERGDAGNFVFQPDIRAFQHIELGDTIGIFYSNEIERRLSNLEGELESAKAFLALNNTGEKLEVIEAAEKSLELASAQALEQRRIYERQKTLYERDLISLQELEIFQTQSEVKDLEKQMAQSALINVSTGAKPEQITYLQTQIKAIQREIRILEKRIDQFTLISPIAGVVTPAFSGDTLTIISDTTRQIILLPIRLRESSRISRNQTIEIETALLSHPVLGKILHIDHIVHRLNGEEIVLAMALVDESGTPLAFGSTVRCQIDCGTFTPMQYLRQFFGSVSIN